MDYFISKERAETDLLDCAAFLAERVKSADGHAEAMSEIVPRYLAKGDVDLAAELANAIDAVSYTHLTLPTSDLV